MLELTLPEYAYATITKFIRDFSRKKNVVIGVSGGLDSSVALKLCVDSLGKERVLAVHMPDKVTPPQDTEDAKNLARDLGVELRLIPIDNFVNIFEESLRIKDEKTIANLKARIRMLILYTIANEENRLVCGTSNKSEILVGYFTKYGDGASDFMPLGDLYKTQVRMLAERIGIPENIMRKKPSAALLPGQFDEEELGFEYSLLDRILYGIELGLKNEDIARYLQIDLSIVEKVEEMHRSSRHKRVLIYIPKIGVRTVNTDWRE